MSKWGEGHLTFGHDVPVVCVRSQHLASYSGEDARPTHPASPFGLLAGRALSAVTGWQRVSGGAPTATHGAGVVGASQGPLKTMPPPGIELHSAGRCG